MNASSAGDGASSGLVASVAETSLTASAGLLRRMIDFRSWAFICAESRLTRDEPTPLKSGTCAKSGWREAGRPCVWKAFAGPVKRFTRQATHSPVAEGCAWARTRRHSRVSVPDAALLRAHERAGEAAETPLRGTSRARVHALVSVYSSSCPRAPVLSRESLAFRLRQTAGEVGTHGDSTSEAP